VVRTLTRLALCALALLFARPGLTQPDLPSRVDRAAACYARFDYDCVLDALEALDIGEAAANHPADVVLEAGRLIAVAWIIRGLPERAERTFSAMLRQWPDYVLEGDGLSPRFFDVFHRARARNLGLVQARALPLTSRRLALILGAERAAEAVAEGVEAKVQSVLLEIALPAPRAVRGPDLRIAVGAGFQAFFETDAEAFDSAFGVAVRLATDRFLGLSFWFAFDRYVHDAALPNPIDPTAASLTVMDLSAGVGYPIYVGPVRFALGLGVGYSAFGIHDVFERGGLLVDAVGEVSATTRSGPGFGIEVRPRLVVVEGLEQRETSTPLTAGLFVVYEL